jgi:hypothetical protein
MKVTSMTDNDKKHPSFGTVRWSRVTGTVDNLFMSSLKHGHFIELEITNATQTRRDYHQTTYHSSGNRPIIRVRMSEAQFAQFITTPNDGSGVPCTITRMDNQAVPQCPPDEQMVQFRTELHEDAKQVTHGARETLSRVRAMLKGKTVRKGDLREIESQLEGLLRNVESNMPFLVKQFHEYMDGVFHDAVAQFEGHVTKRAIEAGHEAMVRDAMRGLGYDEE